MSEIKRASRLAFYFVVGLVLGGLSVSAFASYSGSAAPPRVVMKGPNSLPFNLDTGRYVGFGLGSNGGATLNSGYQGRIGTALVPVSGVRTIPGSALARVAVPLARLAGPIGIGLTLADLLWDEISGFQKPDPNVQQYEIGWIVNGNGSTWSPTRELACEKHAALYSGTGVVKKSSGSGNWNCWIGNAAYGMQPQHGGDCAVGDYIVEGQCVKQAGTVPASDQDIEDAIYAELVARGMGSDLARRLVEAGYEPEVLAEAGPQELSGPSSVDGGSTTSTTSGPAGMTTTTTNITNNLSYEGDTITITQNTVTNRTDPSGNTETTTETVTPPDEEPAPPEEQKDLCKEHPLASGCAPLGTGADNQEVQEQVVPIQQIEAINIGGSGGSCPADRVMNLSHGTVTFSWGNLCAMAVGIRPIVLAMAWLVAGFGFFFGAKRSQ